MLRTSNVREMAKNSRDYNYDFNCWGATLYALGVNDIPVWVDTYEMEGFLFEKTKIVDGKLEKGDILSIWWDGVLQHTATYVGGGKWFHKRGAENGEFTSKIGVLNDYYEHDQWEVRRYNRKLK